MALTREGLKQIGSVKMFLNLLFSPNEGLIFYSPMTVLILCLPVSRLPMELRKLANGCRLSVLLGMLLMAVWWGGNGSLNPTRMLSNFNVPISILAALWFENLFAITRGLFVVCAIWSFLIQAAVIHFMRDGLEPPNRIALLKVGDRGVTYDASIKMVYARRDLNAWQRPYLIPWMISKFLDKPQD